MDYYRVIDDANFPERWHLDLLADRHGGDVDEEAFTLGTMAGPTPKLIMPQQYPGRSLSFTFAGVDLPVVDEVVAATIRGIAAQGEVQFVPVVVQGARRGAEYFIVNPIGLVKCIDERRTEFFRRRTRRDRRPDSICYYRDVVGLKIDPEQSGARHIFRPWGYTIVLVVSSQLKDALQRAKVTGVLFESVC